GPCAFLDVFDPATVFSSIDEGGRYAYGNQPAVMQWNLARFAETLLPLLHDDQQQAVELATRSLGGFATAYDDAWTSGVRAKLGLPAGLDVTVVRALADDLLRLLHEGRVDFTTAFRALGRAARGDLEPARGLFLDLASFDEWVDRWRALGPDAAVMGGVNPVYVPRNHLTEEALA
ncbi:MAG: protein adenylyltransferase SelO family protein, partial [Dietzia sp.]